MNPSIVFKVLATNGPNVLAISKIIGMQNVIDLAPHLEAIEQSYTAGGIIAVLEKNGHDIQAILEEIGPANIAAIAPNAAAIVKTLTSAVAAGEGA